MQAVAWDADDPVGRAMVLFPGHDEWSVSAHRQGCAEVRDVHVVEAWRRRGVATALMGWLERAAAERGFRRIGLTVGLDPDAAAARALYDRLGYRPAHGPFVSSATLSTDEGPRPVYVVAMYLVNDVSRAAPPAPG